MVAEFFVTGTDTGVGKTVLSALLVAALDAVYWKPVQTGFREGTDRDSVQMWAEPPEEHLLPEQYFLELFLNQGLALDEIKDHLKINRGAVDMRKGRIFQKLQDCFKKKGFLS
mgnify:CR=1 FL=1